MKNKIPFHQRISFRQATQTVLVTFVLGLILSGIQISSDLVKEKRRIHTVMTRIVSMVQESAAQSVYYIDKAQASRVVNGILEYAAVCDVRLVDDFKTTIAHQERGLTTGWAAKLLGAPFEDNCSLTYPLTFYPNRSAHGSRGMAVGHIYLELDPYLVAKSFLNRSGLLLVGDIIRNIVLAIVLAALLFTTVTRPLLRLVEAITNIDPGRSGLDKIPTRPEHKHNELGLLTVTINDMLAEIHGLNQGLEARVADRTQALEKTNKTLEDSLNELSQAQEQLVQAEKMAALGGLVAGVSHEISTPLGISVTLASFLERKIKKTSEKLGTEGLYRQEMDAFMDKSLEAAEVISKNLNRAAELIESFKQVAVDQTSGKKRRFKMKAHMQDVLVSLNPRIRKTGHQVTIDCPEHLAVYHDPGAFSQIFTNLVINSLVHGFDGIDSGLIRLSATVEGDVLQWIYEDNGVGITEKTRTRIFDPFYTTKRNQGGSGLGMHIIFNIVTQNLKGRISCDGAPGEGIRIQIQVPLENLTSDNELIMGEAS